MDTKVFDTGMYVYMPNNGLIEGWHKCSPDEFMAYCDTCNDLAVVKGLRWTGAVIPKQLTGQILSLIKQFPNMEVMLSLYYNKDEKQWHVQVPVQKGSGAFVRYEERPEDIIPAGYFFMGTVHSHPGMGAFWSGTDRADQLKKPGIHVVVGTAGSTGVLRTYLCELFLSGSASPAQEVFELPEDLNAPGTAPETWVQQVTEQALIEPPVIKPAFTYVGSESERYWTDLAKENGNRSDTKGGRHRRRVRDFDDVSTFRDRCDALEDTANAEEVETMLHELGSNFAVVELRDIHTILAYEDGKLDQSIYEVVDDILYTTSEADRDMLYDELSSRLAEQE